MRILKEIPCDQCKVTLFTWNQKYIVKFEKGLLEQIYKISEVEVMEVAEVERAVTNPAFLARVMQRFDQMHEDWYKTLEI